MQWLTGPGLGAVHARAALVAAILAAGILLHACAGVVHFRPAVVLGADPDSKPSVSSSSNPQLPPSGS